MTAPRLSETPDIEAIAEVLAAHRPVIGRFAHHLNGVVGCSCMDRVFVAKVENYATHVAQALAPVLAAERVKAEQRAWRDFREWVTEECPHEPDEHAEGTCDLCDWTFAIEAELDDRADRIAVDATRTDQEGSA